MINVRRMIGHCRSCLGRFRVVIWLALGVVGGVVATLGYIQWNWHHLSRDPIANSSNALLVVRPTIEARRKPGVDSEADDLTLDDAEAIARLCKSVLACSPLVKCNELVSHGERRMQTREVWGVRPSYERVGAWSVEEGRFISERDDAEGVCVCVIGQTVVGQLPAPHSPIGEQLQIGNIPFTVVGVLAKKGADLMGNDRDNIVLMPITPFRKHVLKAENRIVDFIVAIADSPEQVDAAKAEIEELLYSRHKIIEGEKAAFEVAVPVDIERIFP